MGIGKKILYVITFASVWTLSYYVLGEDWSFFIQWWFTLLLLGMACMPVTSLIFRQFQDRGYIFSKPIGMALCGYLFWLLSNTKLVLFTPTNGRLCLLLLGVVSYGAYFSQRKKKEPMADSKRFIEHCLQEELVFLFVFMVCCYIKGFKPEAYGTEKFMDYGFLTSMMRADYMPPFDFWYSEGIINYYYFGQYLATMITKVSGVTVAVAYNLMIATIATLSMMLPYCLVYEVMAQLPQVKKIEGCKLPAVAGILGGLLVSCSSNLHFPVFRWIVPALQEMLGLPVSTYWFPDATRYIGYFPETNDKVIHEFPSYSTVLGDLHAHYINLIFVLTVLGILFAWSMQQYERYHLQAVSENKAYGIKDIWNEVRNPAILLVTFFIGMFHMSNYWDFPIYYVIAGAVILFTYAIVYDFKRYVICLTAVMGVFVLVGSSVVALPFTRNFDRIASEIAFATSHTKWYQLLILWGLPVITALGNVCSTWTNFEKNKRYSSLQELNLIEVEERNWFQKDTKTTIAQNIVLFMKHCSVSDLFVLTLSFCAIGLVWLPEVIYVKDIYSQDYARANTMFKLTYQAFILFGICSGYIIIKYIAFASTQRQRRYAMFALICSCFTISYMGHSVRAWFGNVFDYDARKSLDATEFLIDRYPNDYEAIDWLNQNVEGHAIVLEASGDSYSDYERVSVFTGLQTVMGWYVHEKLWRGDPLELNQRAEDIREIYTATDVDYVKQLVERYQIDYIYVGTLEREKYGVISDELLLNLGEIVFERMDPLQPSSKTYILKISNN